MIKLILYFLLSTFIEYWLHRLMHYKNKYNILYKIHKHHHNFSYEELTTLTIPKLSYLFFWYGNLYETLEIIIGQFIPIFFIFLINHEIGLILFFFYHIYEFIATGALLEHNSNITNKIITYFFSVGQCHLEHHRNTNCNFSFKITIWDHVFNTYKFPNKIK